MQTIDQKVKTQECTDKVWYSEKNNMRALEQMTADRTNLDWVVWEDKRCEMRFEKI